jgi:3D (Asp-Asp-Asp) domain-containing protein/uncharacterized protein YabE (DUF348 family)
VPPFRRLPLFPVTAGWASLPAIGASHVGAPLGTAALASVYPSYGSAGRGLLPLPGHGASRSLGHNAPLWALVSLFAALCLLWASTVRLMLDGQLPSPALSLTTVMDRTLLAAETLRNTAMAFPKAQSIVLARLRLGQRGSGEAPWTLVEVDGKMLRATSNDAGIEAALAAAGFRLEPGDRIVALPSTGGHFIQRAVPFAVVDAGLPTNTKAAANTVGEALQALGIDLLTADVVYPAADSPLMPGLRISITRAFPVTITGTDLQLERRTRAASVAELLTEASVLLGPLDRVEPGQDEAVPAHGTVRVVRVREEEQVETRLIPYQTLTQYSDQLGRGTRYRLRAGTMGLVERLIHVVFEDNVEVRRVIASEKVLRATVDEVYLAGLPAMPALPAVTLPNAALTSGLPPGLPVKRVINMVATAYDPGPISTGKSPGHPAYGITATGMRASYGVAAVDPRVIPFYTRVYVPGYGHAIAADTGSAIQGNRIDVYFPTYAEAIQWGRRSVPVYILE